MRRLAPFCLLVANALPFAVRAQVDNQALECTSEPTFWPVDKWALAPPGQPGSLVHYRHHAGGAPGIPVDLTAYTINGTFDSWQTTACAVGGTPNVALLDAFPDLQVDYPTRERGDDIATWTFNNVIYFVVSGDEGDWQGTSIDVAQTPRFRFIDLGLILSADMELNAKDFSFRATNPDTQQNVGCAAGEPRCFDLATIAVHEVGHFFGFNHVNCSDSVMFPARSGDFVLRSISQHEQVGICSVYAPRTRAERDFGDECIDAAECPTGMTCAVDVAYIEAAAAYVTVGYCTLPCTSTNDCPRGYVCDALLQGNACRPGVHLTGSVTTGGNTNTNTNTNGNNNNTPGPGGGGGVVDPDTGLARDLCAACTDSQQCSSGLCVGDGSGTRICTEACVPGLQGEGGGDLGCAAGFDCLPTSAQTGVCWPQDVNNCGAADTLGKLDDACFAEAAVDGADWFNPCGAGLVCFGFKPKCGGQEGACVLFCDPLTPCPSSLQCCYGVDESGNCLGYAPERPNGGCFDIRQEGESCVTGEQSICDAGADCFNFGDAQDSRCYRLCPSGLECGPGAECLRFYDGCGNSFDMCCGLNSAGSGGCAAPTAVDLAPVGMECRDNSDCDSGLCLSVNDDKVCTRSCNIATGAGCPSNGTDIDGDGEADGGFACVSTGGGVGHCAPLSGAVNNPRLKKKKDDGGCRAAGGAGPLLLTLTLCSGWLARTARRSRGGES